MNTEFCSDIFNIFYAFFFLCMKKTDTHDRIGDVLVNILASDSR
jgi:hypothetical protein